uniref:Uncharacterized protein n=1 Tax=Anopheles stephensi TaxID=30069 RepID=A0A182YS49_ANOST
MVNGKYCKILSLSFCLTDGADIHYGGVLGNANALPVDWNRVSDHERVHRQLSVSSDSKLLDDDIREETRVIMRPKKPPRPKSEVFLNKHDPHPRRKRFSAFG